MSIKSINSLVASGYKAKLTNRLRFYKGDRLDLCFSIANQLISEVDSSEVVDGILPIDSPNIEAKLILENQEIIGTVIEDNRVVFRFEPEYQNVGMNHFQIVIVEHCEDGTKDILHTPIFSIEIAEPLGFLPEEDDDTAVVGEAIVGYSRVRSIMPVDIDLGYEPWVDGDIITAERLNDMERRISQNVGALDQLLYTPIAINSFSITPNTAEMGIIVSEVKLTWAYNKAIQSQKLNNVELETDVKTAVFNDISTNKTYTLWATDGKTNASRSVSISFLNGRYYGSRTEDTYDSEFILSLNKQLASSKNTTFTTNCGDSQYIYFAIPSRFGTPTFSVGGFVGGFVKAATIDFTNYSGYTEKYDIYRSNNPSLGNKTVTVG